MTKATYRKLTSYGNTAIFVLSTIGVVALIVNLVIVS